MSGEVRVEAKFRNARLYNLIAAESLALPYDGDKRLRRLREVGPLHGWVQAMKAKGLEYNGVIDLVGLRRKPWRVNRTGTFEWRRIAVQLAAHFDVAIEWLFPIELYEANIAALVTEIDVDRFARLTRAEADVLTLPAVAEATQVMALDRERVKPVIQAALGTLTPRQEFVLILRYGLDNPLPSQYAHMKIERGRAYTRQEIVPLLGVKVQRVHQIEATAIRRLRYGRYGGRRRTLAAFGHALDAFD